jgi:hypothetical protein
VDPGCVSDGADHQVAFAANLHSRQFCFDGIDLMPAISGQGAAYRAMLDVQK